MKEKKNFEVETEFHFHFKFLRKKKFTENGY